MLEEKLRAEFLANPNEIPKDMDESADILDDEDEDSLSDDEFEL